MKQELRVCIPKQELGNEVKAITKILKSFLILNQNDYIMRQIHQLTQVIARVVAAVAGLKGPSQVQQAMEITNQALNEQLDLDIESLLDMDANDMIETLEEKEAVNEENLESIADLFYELAETLSEVPQQEIQTELLLNRSLLIYRHIESSGNIYSIDRNHKIQEIEQRLGL